MKQNVVTFDEKVRFTAIIILSLLSIARGGYWLYNGDSASNDSELYKELADVAPLGIWGIIFIIGGAILLLSNLYILNAKKKRIFYIMFIIGTGILAVGYLVVGMASVQNSINWLTPAHNTIFFVGFSALFLLGCKELWKSQKYKEI
ncbi:hypothetical protein [Staphylococcus phage PT94]